MEEEAGSNLPKKGEEEPGSDSLSLEEEGSNLPREEEEGSDGLSLEEEEEEGTDGLSLEEEEEEGSDGLSLEEEEEDDSYGLSLEEDLHGLSLEEEEDSYGRSFKQCYACYPFSLLPSRQNLEEGDKIIMPLSALNRLTNLSVDFPFLFQIQNSYSGRVSHCGVLEFTADEKTIFLPQWMMDNLSLKEGDIVQLRNASLQKGSYIKLQPHATKFIELNNPKAVLETKLRNFSCLTSGDTIMISHNDKKFYIDVVETKPSCAISIIETDCDVDFAPPLDYKEPEKPIRGPNPIASKSCPTEKEEPNFRPFTGRARRLDGEPSTTRITITERSTDIGSKLGLPKCGKVVFGSEVKQNAEKAERVSNTTKEENLKNGGEKKCFQPFTGRKYVLGGW